ncbi:helix-turn-helix domain-containing protein [Actinoplanes subtropicus]|uniref:helix-turn-helix domain-containing protein n=1 Tax=Actinoplanes subtropicus TaxID=543632 RepID=UPI0006915764|nr:helix-turn-helix domain-containing protein [Actinoplanes subtropicus]
MTDVQTWSTDAVPEHLRFAAWAEMMRDQHIQWDLSTPIEAPYAARIRYRQIYGTQLADARCDSFSGHHVPANGAPDVVGIQLHLSGRVLCGYAGERFTIEPGDLFIWSSDREGTFDTVGPHRELTFLVSRTRVPQSLDAMIDRGRPVAAGPGTGLLAIAADQIRGIAREMAGLPDDRVARAVDNVIDLLGAAAAPAHEAGPGQRAALLAQMRRYILDRLGDRSMSATSIAAAHGISVRTVHLVFAESGISVGRWTRQQRLERCRRELSSAAGRTTVTDVAFNWGFSDTAHFSRCFKQEFGVSPSTLMSRSTSKQPPD